MNELEGSPNEEGTCMQIIPTTGSIDTQDSFPVVMPIHTIPVVPKLIPTNQVEIQQQPPLEKAAFVDGYLHGCSISPLAI